MSFLDLDSSRKLSLFMHTQIFNTHKDSSDNFQRKIIDSFIIPCKCVTSLATKKKTGVVQFHSNPHNIYSHQLKKATILYEKKKYDRQKEEGKRKR